MRFHHMCVVTRDLDRQIAFWRDVMGFDLAVRLSIPDGEDFGLNVLAPRSLMRDTLGHPEACASVALMTSKDGAMIELLAPEQPDVETTPPEKLLYRHTGVHELGLAVDDIDAFFAKVKDAGYRVQTPYVWSCANMGRSFIFYDPEGNMIQMWQPSQAP
jgi:catechol 2,3-dioxygenase-like lactoylglutathione lyase family enzyme